MNIFNDSMAAAFVPLLLLLAVGWGMYVVLGREDEDHGWWIATLQSLHLVPKEPEPELPIYTRTNVLHLSPPDPERVPPKPEPVDYRPVIRRSRLVFRNVGLVVLLLTAVHAFSFYRRSNPYFLWGPAPTKFVNPAQRGRLPDAVPGAGGAGAVPFAGPSGQPPPPGSPAPGRPGLPPRPGGPDSGPGGGGGPPTGGAGVPPGGGTPGGR